MGTDGPNSQGSLIVPLMGKQCPSVETKPGALGVSQAPAGRPALPDVHTGSLSPRSLRCAGQLPGRPARGRLTLPRAQEPSLSSQEGQVSMGTCHGHGPGPREATRAPSLLCADSRGALPSALALPATWWAWRPLLGLLGDRLLSARTSVPSVGLGLWGGPACFTLSWPRGRQGAARMGPCVGGAGVQAGVGEGPRAGAGR